MTTKFTSTGLKLVQDPDNRVPADTIAVPGLQGPAAEGAPPLYTIKEPMYFRAVGSKEPAVLLRVTINGLLKSAVVAPATVTKFGHAGVDIEARRMTWRERVRNGAKAEVWLAAIASIVAIAAILSACIAPSAEQKAAKAEFTVQLQPIEQRLASAIRTKDAIAIKKADDDLSAALNTDSKASDGLSNWVKFSTLALGLVSAIIAICVAVKRAKSTT